MLMLLLQCYNACNAVHVYEINIVVFLFFVFLGDVQLSAPYIFENLMCLITRE